MFDFVLIVEEDDARRESLSLMLLAKDCRVLAANGAEEALAILHESAIDVIFCSAHLPGIEDFDLVKQLSRRAPEIPIILTAGEEDDSLASQAVERGAFDYIALPSSPDEVQMRLRRAHQQNVQHRMNRLLERDLASTRGDEAIVAASDRMIALLELMERIAGYKSTVLVTGEPGTGKEVIARAVHTQSPRRNGPFIVVHCGSIPEGSLERELFGQVPGGLTGAQSARRGLISEANSGSLFLDEVSELSIGLQLKLLHAIQEEEIHAVGASKATKIDVRIIAATSRDLEVEMSEGRFREDLFYRLDVVRLDVPALRDRQEDLPLLVDHFLGCARQRLGKKVRGISDEALDFLLAYAWPGNIRELENMIERAVILSDDENIEISSFPQIVQSAAPDEDGNLSLKRARHAFEAQLIRRALARTQGNRTHAAKLLDISHRALLYKLKDYGIRD